MVFSFLFCLLTYSLVSTFTTHPDLLGREDDNDFYRDKQIQVTHMHISTHTLTYRALTHLTQYSNYCCSGETGGTGAGVCLKYKQENFRTTWNYHETICTHAHILSFMYSHTTLHYCGPDPHLEKSRLTPRNEDCHKQHRFVSLLPLVGPLWGSLVNEALL